MQLNFYIYVFRISRDFLVQLVAHYAIKQLIGADEAAVEVMLKSVRSSFCIKTYTK